MFNLWPCVLLIHSLQNKKKVQVAHIWTFRVVLQGDADPLRNDGETAVNLGNLDRGLCLLLQTLTILLDVLI